VVGRDGLLTGQGGKQGRLTHVGQADDAKGQTHNNPVYGPESRATTALAQHRRTGHTGCARSPCQHSQPAPAPQATSRRLDPARPLLTNRRVGIRCRNSSTCETSPTTRPPARSSSNTFITTSRVSASSVPNPSSTNHVSNAAPPVSAETTSAKPSASASDARNDSPPESVFVERTAPE